MKYLKNRRLKNLSNTVKISNSPHVYIPKKYILDQVGSKQNYIIKVEDLDKIKKTTIKKTKGTSLRTFLNSKRFKRECGNKKLTLSQCREIKKVLKSIHLYNEYVRIEIIFMLINNNIQTRFLDRIRWSLNLIASDSIAMKVILYGLTEGQKQWKHKSDRVKGDKNPGYQHGGKFSPYSKKFVKYDNSEESEVTRKQVFKKNIVSRTKNNNDTLTLDYYTSRGYTEKEAQKLLSERQTTFSLKKCIEKYGEDKGRKRWQARQDKWQDTLTTKSQEEINDINRRKFSGGGGHSKISQKLFNELNIPKARYGTNDGEYRIKLDSGKHVSFDFYYNGKVIEFYGDIWHANPKIFTNEKDTPLYGPFKKCNSFNKKITAKEIWQKDEKRITSIEQAGYPVKIVWENDFKQNSSNIIKECLEFLET